MIAYPGERREPLEAGLKYLILAGASAAFLVFGMAPVHAETGTMEFSRMASATNQPALLLLTGFALIVSGIGFKRALVPFHMCTPDVHQGAPAPEEKLEAVPWFGNLILAGLMVLLIWFGVYPASIMRLIQSAVL